MIEAATEALKHHGVAGMSFTDVLERSHAARGAIYHHFPGGKDQLIAEAVARNGQDVLRAMETITGSTPEEVVVAFFAGIRPVLEQSANGGGCAVAAATLDLNQNSTSLQDIASIAFDSWINQLGQALKNAGMEPAEANDTACLLITLLEGAHVLCRASADLQPLDQTARAAIALVRERTQKTTQADHRHD